MAHKLLFDNREYLNLKEVRLMKIMVIIKLFFLIMLTAVVMIMLMPAMIFGGTKFLNEVYQVFIKEFNKIRGLKTRKAKA